MKLELKEEDIERINSIFKKYKEVDKVLIYGSRAKGNFHKGSDIDLVLIRKNLSFDLLLKIERN